jgi:hypothetical protein
MPRRMGRPGLLGTMARTAVIAGTANAVVGGMNRHQQAAAQPAAAPAAPAPPPDWAAQQQWAAQQAAAAAPADDGPDMIEQLKQLAELHAQGILTDAEFDAQKAKLLNA